MTVMRRLATHDFRDGLQRRTGVAYDVPEREFLTGHLYGHPAPKRAVDPSNDGGVSVQRPPYGAAIPPQSDHRTPPLSDQLHTQLESDFVCLEML